MISTWETQHALHPLAHYLIHHQAGGTVGQAPKSVRSLWPTLGYIPNWGVRNQADNTRRWRGVLDKAPHIETWARSRRGLRAPQRWPRLIEDAFCDLDVHLAPISFAAACFPGRGRIATAFTSWRGMPALCAAAHGWELTATEEDEACHAVRALADFVPFVVYACNPVLSNVPLPITQDSVLKRLQDRERFERDPLSCTNAELRRAVDVDKWPAHLIRGLPRREWVPRTRRVPVERSLVEAGVGGWQPVAT